MYIIKCKTHCNSSEVRYSYRDVLIMALKVKTNNVSLTIQITSECSNVWALVHLLQDKQVGVNCSGLVIIHCTVDNILF